MSDEALDDLPDLPEDLVEALDEEPTLDLQDLDIARREWSDLQIVTEQFVSRFAEPSKGTKQRVSRIIAEVLGERLAPAQTDALVARLLEHMRYRAASLAPSCFQGAANRIQMLEAELRHQWTPEAVRQAVARAELAERSATAREREIDRAIAEHRRRVEREVTSQNPRLLAAERACEMLQEFASRNRVNHPVGQSYQNQQLIRSCGLIMSAALGMRAVGGSYEGPEGEPDTDPPPEYLTRSFEGDECVGG